MEHPLFSLATKPDIPSILAAGALILDVGANQTGIDGKALAADDALRHHPLEDATEDFTVAELAMS